MEERGSGGNDDMPLQLLLRANTPALLCAHGTPNIHVLMDQRLSMCELLSRDSSFATDKYTLAWCVLIMAMDVQGGRAGLGGFKACGCGGVNSSHTVPVHYLLQSPLKTYGNSTVHIQYPYSTRYSTR